MVNPIQTLLSQLLNNVLLLVGGLVMCMLTSWRLTVLAFTTIGPIVYVNKSYASWAQRIYYDIFAALAQANSKAVQALANIRTVRAFSTEPLETSKYRRGTEMALQKGLKDAKFGSITIMLTNFLDLGTGVLILWFGGHVVLNKDGDGSGLTVGKLIAFQLFWSMIANAYQALAEVLNSFTRAAGAAQRALGW
jgi:ATP-binding cassette subfamily B protein